MSPQAVHLDQQENCEHCVNGTVWSPSGLPGCNPEIGCLPFNKAMCSQQETLWPLCLLFILSWVSLLTLSKSAETSRASAFGPQLGLPVVTWRVCAFKKTITKQSLIKQKIRQPLPLPGLFVLFFPIHSRAAREFFTVTPAPCRVINTWNSLPQEVVAATSMDGFWRELDKHMKQRSISGY
ncbi:UNVERIFIED_CONTAM: hypothetical protein K2H54_037217 [Gekko kuhli]